MGMHLRSYNVLPTHSLQFHWGFAPINKSTVNASRAGRMIGEDHGVGAITDHTHTNANALMLTPITFHRVYGEAAFALHAALNQGEWPRERNGSYIVA